MYVILRRAVVVGAAGVALAACGSAPLGHQSARPPTLRAVSAPAWCAPVAIAAVGSRPGGLAPYLRDSRAITDLWTVWAEALAAHGMTVAQSGGQFRPESIQWLLNNDPVNSVTLSERVPADFAAINKICGPVLAYTAG